LLQPLPKNDSKFFPEGLSASLNLSARGYDCGYNEVFHKKQSRQMNFQIQGFSHRLLEILHSGDFGDRTYF